VDASEQPPVHASHWIAENVWRANRHGLDGWVADLDTGWSEPVRVRLARLLDELRPYGRRLRSSEHLLDAGVLLAGNGSDRQRYVHAQRGMPGLVRWLADQSEDVDD
jgi:gamma-glutamyl:cysteine ligase YbdK (ATP-grasp superfamily)